MTESNVHFNGGGVIPEWGNYGGPGWTGGSTIHDNFGVDPTNTVDGFFKEHDLAYANAKYSSARDVEIMAADAKLAKELNGFMLT
jgi:hypothetical protein